VGEPADVTGADLRRAVVHLACATLLARHWPARGSRHETALAAASFLLRANLDESTTVNIVTAAARAAKDPEWSDRKRAALDTVAALASGEPATGGPTLAELMSGDGRRVLQRIRKWLGVEGREPAIFPLTDLGNAERLVHQHGRDVRYCYALRSWFSWTGSRWEPDAGAVVMAHAKHTVRTIYSEAVAGADPAARAAVAAWARKSEHEARVRAAVFLAQSEPGIPIEVAQFDTNPWALNVANGVVDLRTGQLRPHRREDYLSKLAPVAFDPAARCPRWLRFLSEIFNANDTMIAFVQKAIGYALTGVTTEQVFFLLYGTGANGKTTLLKVIVSILCDYAMSTRPETFMVKGPDANPIDVARLRGARLVTAAEADNGQRLAEALMKQMTGGDVMTARFMRAEFFDFVPEFKIFLASNFKPVIRGSDHAMWRRVRLVPFAVAIPPEKQDRQLEVALRAEAPGILAWAVQGCLAWQREGLGLPDEVRVATDAYRVEMDVLGQFIADRCRIDGAGEITTAELYGAYRSWCDEVRETPMSKRTFGLRLADRGVTQARSKAARGWRGIRLRTSLDPDEPADSGDASAPVTQETGESGLAEVRARISKSTGNKRHVASPTGDTSPDEEEILL
jgi:putative DNA primase/helicase